jgi:hypothetical protein
MLLERQRTGAAVRHADERASERLTEFRQRIH